MIFDDIIVLACEHRVPWIVAWHAIGPSGIERDRARSECQKALRSERDESRCAVVTE